jgi:hypothetical protein
MTNGQPEQQAKKGTHPLVWVAVGCASLLLLGSIILFLGGVFVANKVKEVAEEMEDNPVETASKLIAAANPDIELVDADKRERVVTFRNKETGEEFTFDFKDIEEGRVHFSSDDETVSVELEAGEGDEGSLKITTDEGTASFGAGIDVSIPSWLPIYPGTEPQGTYSTEDADGRTGAFTIETHDSLDDLIDFYAEKLEGKGFKVLQRAKTNLGASLNAQSPDESLTVSIAASAVGDKVQAVVNFTEK